MFSWICPECGRDVPPSKTECPSCEERKKEYAAYQAANPQLAQPAQDQAAAPPPAYVPPPFAPPPPPQQRFEPQPTQRFEAPPQRLEPQRHEHPGQPPAQQLGAPYPPYGQQAPYGQQPPQYPPQQGQYGQHPQSAWGAPPQQKKPLPTWLLSVIFAVAILAVGSIVYFGLQRYGKTNPQEKAGLENPANPSKAKVSNPLQKYVEVVGIRMMTDKKKPVARFVVVNHSNTSIDGLAANVTLWASTSRSEEDSVASFGIKLPHLGPGESREMTEPLKTKLKIYELPDWQNANADVQITAP